MKEDSRPVAWLSFLIALLGAKFNASFDNDKDERTLLQLDLHLLMRRCVNHGRIVVDIFALRRSTCSRRFADKTGIVLSDRLWTHLQGYNKRFQPPLVVQPDLVQVPTLFSTLKMSLCCVEYCVPDMLALVTYD